MQQQLAEDEPSYVSIRLTKTTAKRLQKNAIAFGDSYERIVSRILDEKEGKELNSQERSF